MRSFYDELNRGTVVLHNRAGYKSLVVSAGIDKADHGSIYALLLHQTN